MIDFFDFVRTEKKLPDFFTFFRKTFTSMKRSIDADLELVFDDGTMMVHSGVLILASDVFKAMLSSGTSEQLHWKLTLPNKSIETFEIFYKMLHIESAKYVKCTDRYLLCLIEMAHEYQTKALFEEIVKLHLSGFIEKNVSNLMEVYMLAKKLDDETLTKKVIEGISKTNCLADMFFDDHMYSMLPQNLSSLWPLRYKLLGIIKMTFNVTDKLDFLKDKQGCLAVLKFAINSIPPLCEDTQKYKGCDVHKKIQTVYCDAMNITEDLLDHSPIDGTLMLNPKL